MPRRTINAYRYALATGSPLAAATTTDAPSRTTWNASRSRASVRGDAPDAGHDLATDERAADERTQRDERCRDREAWRPCDRESQEHHIAGHVRDEDVTEQQVAERVDQTRDERQAEQQRRERTVPAGPTGTTTSRTSSTNWLAYTALDHLGCLISGSASGRATAR